MILELMMDILISLIAEGLDFFNMVNIPLNGIQVLAEFCAYGSYIVGADLLLCFASVVLMWMGLKLLLGIALFIWRLLPLT